MGKQLSISERSEALFREAARQAVLSFTENELDEFLQRILLASDINLSFTSNLNEVASQENFRMSNNMATEMALRLRYFLGLDDLMPLFNLPALLDNKLNVLLFPIEQHRIAGACAFIEGHAFIFISKVKQEDVLFTCAHELAHLLLLSTQQKNKGGAIIDPVDNMLAPQKTPTELFADTFAREFLIPNRGLGVALQKVRGVLNIETGAVSDIQLLYLSRIFGVNLLTMARKCEKEKLLPKGAARLLNQRLIEKHGGAEKRAEELGLPSRSKINITPIPPSLELAIIKEINMSKALIGSTETRSRQIERVSPARPYPIHKQS